MNKLLKLANILDDFFKEDNLESLKEVQEDMKIEFENDNVKYLSFSFDKQLPAKDFPKGLFPFFSKGEALVNSFCDYIIFSEYNNHFFVLLIELKKGDNNVKKQLEAGECFVKYIIATLNRVYKLKITPDIRQISIRGKHLKPKPRQKQKEVEYINNFNTFSGSKFRLKMYLK